MADVLQSYLLLIGLALFLISLFDGKTKIGNFAPKIVAELNALIFRMGGLIVIVFSGMPIGG